MWLEEHLRHRSGFGVHSPMLYRVIKGAMMPRRLQDGDHTLYNTLRELGVGRRTATRLQNLFLLEEYSAWRIDEPIGEGELGIVTLRASEPTAQSIAARCRELPTATVCIIHPMMGGKHRRRLAKELVKQHCSMSASKPSFTLLFQRKDLHKQHITI